PRQRGDLHRRHGHLHAAKNGCSSSTSRVTNPYRAFVNATSGEITTVLDLRSHVVPSPTRRVDAPSTAADSAPACRPGRTCSRGTDASTSASSGAPVNAASVSGASPRSALEAADRNMPYAWPTLRVVNDATATPASSSAGMMNPAAPPASTTHAAGF